MSLAQNLSLLNHSVEGNVALPLPVPTHTPRPERRAAKRTKTWVRWVIGGMAWALVMSWFMVQVYRSSLVLAEAKSITRTREELTLLQEANQQLDAALVKATSVTEVEKWAISHGMNRPTTIRMLSGDPAAVANRPDPAAAPVDGPAGGSTSGVWQYVMGLMARVGSVIGLTANSR